MSLVADIENFLPVLASSGAGLVGLGRSVAFVREGQRGIKLRFGKAVLGADGKPKVIEPGLRFMIPFVHTLVRRHVRQETIRCDHQEVMLADNTVFMVSAVAIFRVTDIYRALFEIDNLEDSIDELCQAVLRSLVSKRELSQVSEIDEMSDELLTQVRARTRDWGIEFITFNLTNCAPTAHTAELILLGAQAARRADALKKATVALGFTPQTIDPSLAAAIIGTPVVATIGNRQTHRTSAGFEEVDEEDD